MVEANYRKSTRGLLPSQGGFTIVDALVAMVIALIIGAAISSVFLSQNRIYVGQQKIAYAQQNLRAAIDIMARDIRMAGYDPRGTGLFGISDISFRDLDNNPEVNGSSSITLSYDWDEDGSLDSNETISYSIYDSNGDGKLDLAREVGSGGRQLLAEGIKAFALAYAFDNDGDGILDTDNNATIWAIDSDNDGTLDINLDTNRDGRIDSTDDPNGIDIPGGVNVPLQRIRAVRIWLLADVITPGANVTGGTVYVVGDTHLNPQPGHAYRLLDTVIRCRNLGL